jgi:hypothetical protein
LAGWADGRKTLRCGRRHLHPSSHAISRKQNTTYRARIGERIADAKAAMRHNGLHQGGTRPFGWKFGEGVGRGRTRKLIEDPAEQAAIAEMRAMRTAGASQPCSYARKASSSQ